MIRRYSVVAVTAAVVAALLVAGAAGGAKHYRITSTHQIKPSVLKKLRGKQGAAGITYVRRVSASSAPYCASGGGACQVASADATCPSGSYSVGGAANVDTIQTPISTFAGRTDYAAVSDNESMFTGTLTVTAYCARGAGVTAAAADRASAGTASSSEASLATKLRAQAAKR